MKDEFFLRNIRDCHSFHKLQRVIRDLLPTQLMQCNKIGDLSEIACFFLFQSVHKICGENYDF